MVVLLNHAGPEPSDWVRRWAPLLRPGATALDLACGSGRHVRWLAAQGMRVTGVDRDAAAVQPLASLGEIIVADVENGPWPLVGRRFDGVVVTNYLWRPLWPQMLDLLADGGVLIYETFADGQQTIGRPSRPDFLLQPGELLSQCQGLHVVAYEHGVLPSPERFVQRIVAVRGGERPARHPLAAAEAPGG